MSHPVGGVSLDATQGYRALAARKRLRPRGAGAAEAPRRLGDISWALVMCRGAGPDGWPPLLLTTHFDVLPSIERNLV